jgi:ABC-type transport system involved in cytochrome c biogenesis permease subunit
MITLVFKYAFLLAVGFYLLSFGFYLFHWPKTSVAVLLTGFLLHTLFQISRSLVLGVWLPNSIIGGAYFLPWSVALISLGIRLYSGDKKNTAMIDSMIIPICVFSFLSLMFANGIFPPGPTHETFFVPLYYGIDTIAQACFILGAWFAVFHIRGKNPDKIFNYLIVSGFIFYSLSQVVGAYWSYLGWALPLQWSAKHIQSASVWCYYAAILHLRYFQADSKKEAWFALGGLVLLFVFIYGSKISTMIFPGIGG